MKRTILLSLAAALLAAAPAAGATQMLAKPSHKTEKTLVQPTRYWYDGSKRRQLRVETDRHADFSARAAGGAVVRKALGKIDVDSRDPAVSPLFTDADAPAVRRAAPGGVIVTLARPTDEPALRALLTPYGVEPSRMLDASGTRWLVDSAPGTAALDLANALYESGRFVSAAPNWWREREQK